MCNRFENKDGIAIYKKLDDKTWNDILKKTSILANYSNLNVKPTNIQPVVDFKNGEFNITERSWGYYFPNTPRPYMNIQTETLLKKGREKLKQQFIDSRAIVGATSFYEWIIRHTERGKEVKVCMQISIPSIPQFFFPAILGEDNGNKNFTILTINPNKIMEKVHSRMPVIFSPQIATQFLKDKAENLLDYCVPLDDTIPMVVDIAPDFMLNKDAKVLVEKERERIEDELERPQLF